MQKMAAGLPWWRRAGAGGDGLNVAAFHLECLRRGLPEAGSIQSIPSVLRRGVEALWKLPSSPVSAVGMR